MACIYHTIDTCWELQCTSALSSEMNDSEIAHLLVTMTVLKMPLPWTREMAQQLRALSVPPEITSSIPSNPTKIYNHLQWLSLIHNSEPTRHVTKSRMPSSS